ncbi:MAG TPA: MFS transporter [Chloroflexota bacterium]|nr:MFS transporter [Chloroflexota bacterium]
MLESVARRVDDKIVAAIFVASGAAGLIYQVVWSSQLVLVFGNTSEAVGTIVTAFMAGLGFGGLAGGLIGPRLRSPLRAYGLTELAIAACALLVPLGFQAIDLAYRSAYDSTSATTVTLLRLGLALATVTPVTFLMGLTLPLLTRHLVTSLRMAGAHIGSLYSANTLGAMAGSLISGFVLIELFGLSATAHMAVALNALAGGVALLLARGVPAAAPVSEQEVDAEPALERREGLDAQHDGVILTQPLRRAVYAASFVSGFVALALEVLWTRMLAEGTGSQIYQFVGILAVFLLGIAAGGGLYRAVSRPGRDSILVLAALFVGVAASTIVTVPLGTLWPVHNAAIRALMLLPATTCMGYAFPLAAKLVSRSARDSAHGVGFLYAWNTVGSILGTLSAAFILTATLGTNNSILLLASADAATGLALLVVCRGKARIGWAAAGAIVFLVPPVLVGSGSALALTTTQRMLNGWGVPYIHGEDRLSTIDAVGGDIGDRTLYTSGTTMSSLVVETKLMAYLPKIMRPAAQDFLDICFGVGTTFRSGVLLGMHTDAVDLSPSVPKMMPVFYDDAEQIQHNPLARIVTADGRNYVRLTSKKYDLISVDPPPPIQTAGASVLYSKQFYADAHKALKPGGLMLQWVYFGVDLPQLQEHIRTFRSEFPHVTIFIHLDDGAIYMLGSDAPITWDAPTVSRFLETPGAKADLALTSDHDSLPNKPWPDIIQGMRWISDEEVDRFVGSGPLITDDHPLTEYYLLHELQNRGHAEVTGSMLRELTAR